MIVIGNRGINEKKTGKARETNGRRREVEMTYSHMTLLAHVLCFSQLLYAHARWRCCKKGGCGRYICMAMTSAHGCREDPGDEADRESRTKEGKDHAGSARHMHSYPTGGV